MILIRPDITWDQEIRTQRHRDTETQRKKDEIDACQFAILFSLNQDYYPAMEINLLVLNLGNSRLAMGCFAAGELTRVQRIAHAQRGDWAGALSELWKSIESKDAAIVAASVNPTLESALEDAVSKATGRDIVWVGKDLDLPIAVLTDEPELTGVDRILNVAAAYDLMGNACVVVDAGTAITIDVCNDSGEFLGGSIAPGASLMLQSLHDKTAVLPKVELAAPGRSMGKEHRAGHPARRLSRHSRNGQGNRRELRHGAGPMARHHRHRRRCPQTLRRLGSRPRRLTRPDALWNRAGIYEPSHQA